METTKINEDFLDAIDTNEVTRPDVEVTAEENPLTPKQWNRKYVHEYSHMIVLFRMLVGVNAERAIPKIKALFEKVLDMYYPDHAPV